MDEADTVLEDGGTQMEFTAALDPRLVNFFGGRCPLRCDLGLDRNRQVGQRGRFATDDGERAGAFGGNGQR